jgi:uncharacterized alpha-E superfamily protein
MSRYLERAEHTARMIDVHLNLMLDASAVSVDLRWARVVESLGSGEMEAGDGYAITNALAFDAENRFSIVSSISAARENARQVREQTSSEMWEQLNRLYHEVKQSGTEESWEAQPDVFLRSVKEGAHLFQGITDSTMSHGDGWSFIQAGRFLERARVLTSLLKVHFAEFPTFEFGQHLEWLGLLKSCTAFEAYCKVYTAELRADRIAEFLLLNEYFPHSVRFAVDRVHEAFLAMSESSSVRSADRLTRLTGRLRASLSFSQIDEVMAVGLPGYLHDILRQCAEIDTAIYQIFIDYPIESAIEA